LRGKLWIYPGEAAWYFITLSKQVAQDIRADFGGAARGFGSLPVQVRIGETTWKTSIFPDSSAFGGSGSYLLPVKKAVRKAEGMSEGDTVSYILSIDI